MRGSSLNAIRSRVERLASAWPSWPEPIIIHWKFPYERCPPCGADLTAHAEALAISASVP